MTFVRVDRIIARVANINGGESRKPGADVFGRYKIGNEEIRQSEFCECVPQENIFCSLLVQSVLQLKTALTQTRRENRILFVVVAGGRQACSPIRPTKGWIRENQ